MSLVSVNRRESTLPTSSIRRRPGVGRKGPQAIPGDAAHAAFPMFFRNHVPLGTERVDAIVFRTLVVDGRSEVLNGDRGIANQPVARHKPQPHKVYSIKIAPRQNCRRLTQREECERTRRSTQQIILKCDAIQHQGKRARQELRRATLSRTSSSVLLLGYGAYYRLLAFCFVS